jgi:hypothetical protein
MISIESVFLNERCQGAIEALGYLKEFSGNIRPEDFRERVLVEIDDLIGLLLSGSVVDFRQRIKRY